MTDISDVETGHQLTTHLWFKDSILVDHLRPGDVVEFDAQMRRYRRGYADLVTSSDWCLKRPTNVQILDVAADES